MKKSTFWLVVGLAAFGIWKLTDRPSPTPIVESASPAPIPSATASAADFESVDVDEVRETVRPVIRESEISVAASAPSPEKVRAEVEKNPHITPPALIAFAAGLAPKMEAAAKSPAAAEKFFGELRECVHSPKLAESRTIRALCLRNIRRLGQKRPELSARAEAELEKAEPELVELTK